MPIVEVLVSNTKSIVESELLTTPLSNGYLCIPSSFEATNAWTTRREHEGA
jgi:hypothetical protein